MSNRLANENSLYLRQHGNNPVNWYPWGPEALAEAASADKPLLISIGYSACHWCHVMAHECFEDEKIAQLMNQVFVCVKVDREERPDIDKIYMDSYQILNGGGGWPLNIIALPDGRPCTGVTYLPPDHRRGAQTTWPEYVMRIQTLYSTNKQVLEQTAGKLTTMLTEIQNIQESAQITNETLTSALINFTNRFDNEFGGFGKAPKFPPSMGLNFLLNHPSPPIESLRDQAITTTLDAMAYGGMYDQLGGGFARYSVDNFWKIPHFEKMLYDNALLLDIYSKSFVKYGNPLYRDIAYETIGWLQREMELPEGGFSAALDADTEGHEGATYVWTPSQICEVLGEELGTRFCAVYDISESGNFENGTSNPHMTEHDYLARCELKEAREQLLALRQTRAQPGKDTKLVVFWNGMLIHALVEAAWVFGEPDWMKLAEKAAAQIWDKCVHDENKLQSVLYGETARFNAYLDDYAALILAYLTLAGKSDWVNPGSSAGYRRKAEALLETVRRHFGDSSSPGYFFTSDNHEALVRRSKDVTDNAVPCGNSILLQCFWEYYCLTGTGKEDYEKLVQAFTRYAMKAPGAVSNALATVAVAEADAVRVIQTNVDIDSLRQGLIEKGQWKRWYVTKSDSNKITKAGEVQEEAQDLLDLISKC